MSILITGEMINDTNVLIVQALDDTCDFPLCDRKIVHDRFCIYHKIYSEKPVVKKEVYRIPARSKKRIKEQPIYRAKVKAAAEEDDDCEVRSPDCEGKMTGFNHIQKRSPKNWLNRKNCERSCNGCQTFIEKNIKWAKKHGHFISKFKK